MPEADYAKLLTLERAVSRVAAELNRGKTRQYADRHLPILRSPTSVKRSPSPEALDIALNQRLPGCPARK